ncbi:MAG: hypothetical protein GXC73_06225 [Chitinophagaceae bacterium]|nr:hypothetical protein [Chitinophagaceae bacterium]
MNVKNISFLFLVTFLSCISCSKKNTQQTDAPASPVSFTDPLVVNQNTYWPAPQLAKPGYLQTVLDPVFGTKITRIAGDPGTALPNITGAVWASQQLRHNYSKIQPWNADQSMIFLNRHSPNLWLDGNTYQVLFTRNKPGSHLLWSHTEPRIMYHTGSTGNNQLGKWDVVSNISTELIDLRAYSNCTFGEGEGNFNQDGTKVMIYGKRNSDNKQVMFITDVVNKTKGTDIEITDMDNCTMSPSGNYIVVGFGNDEIKVIRVSDAVTLWSDNRYGLPSHFDVQVDQNNDEVIVGVGKTSPYNGHVIKRKVSDGTITTLVNKGYASHTSGRNIGRPGWVYVTYANLSTNAAYLPYINEIVAVKLDGSRVERLGNIRVDKSLFTNSSDQYLAEAHGCPSPDGKRVIFASDWNKGDFPVQAYVIDFRGKN